MNLYNFADKIVFKILQDIESGYLEITSFDGVIMKFGNPEDSLKAYIKIKKPNFTFNLIKGGSIGFAECYMRDEFETDNLSNLIEITARNIKVIYKFSGLLDLPIINFLKNIFIKNTKSRSKENIAKHYDLGNEFFSLWLDKTLTYSSAIFEKKNQDFSFDGYIEGNQLMNGDVNVIVADGFTRNVALKTAEGTANFMTGELKKALGGTIIGKVSSLLNFSNLKKFKKRLDPRLYNGAIFIGLDSPVVKSHGGTDYIGFSNSLDVCCKIIKGNLIDKIKRNI